MGPACFSHRKRFCDSKYTTKSVVAACAAPQRTCSDPYSPVLFSNMRLDGRLRQERSGRQIVINWLGSSMISVLPFLHYEIRYLVRSSTHLISAIRQFNHGSHAFFASEAILWLKMQQNTALSGRNITTVWGVWKSKFAHVPVIN